MISTYTPNFKPSKSEIAKRKKQKKKDKRPGMSEAHLKNIRALPCIITGAKAPSDAHHLKCTGERGMGLRSTDKWTVPLDHDVHINGVEKAGAKNEERWFLERGIECLEFANALWNARHDFKVMEVVWLSHFEKKQEVIDEHKN